MRCEPDGSDCSPIPGATGPEYTVQAGDAGMTIRMHVVARVNPIGQLPDSVDAYTPLSAVVTYPPGTPAPSAPGGGGGGGAEPAVVRRPARHRPARPGAGRRALRRHAPRRRQR